ncbi:MAG: hypothetical protein GQ535_13355 [Rhodobacteraceae bacterium]|nr:hypothetical protein [Paracoccaceae bacterium]
MTIVQTRMGHVTESWADTPDIMGLLPTAIAEAEMAIFHAGYVATSTGNVVAIVAAIKGNIATILATTDAETAARLKPASTWASWPLAKFCKRHSMSGTPRRRSALNRRGDTALVFRLALVPLSC